MESKLLCAQCKKEKYIYDFPYYKFGKDPEKFICNSCTEPIPVIKRKQKMIKQVKKTNEPKLLTYTVTFDTTRAEEVENWT